MNRPQHTLGREVEHTGVGLHSGAPATVRLLPAPPGTGRVFVRVDLPDRPAIPASIEQIGARPRQTALEANGAEVQTVEHLLASLAGLHVDNVTIEIDGPEVPGGDGSAREFVESVQEAGIVEQPFEKPVYRIDQPISISKGDVSLVGLPSETGTLTVSYTLDYHVGFLDSQHLTIEMNPGTFVRDLAPARTFVMHAEAEELRRRGLGKGANYQNTLVVGDVGVIENTLRFPDEFVRHKMLDLVGDLSLLDVDLVGQIIAIKSGHDANRLFAQKLAERFKKGRPAPFRREPASGAARSAPPAPYMDINRLRQVLPHRYPFLLVDRITEWDEGKRVVGIKNVTINEEFFQGHFPGKPMMPGVLQIEAMAQVAGCLLLHKCENQKMIAVLMTIDKVKLRKAVVPGDRLILEANAIRLKDKIGHVRTSASVDGTIVAEAELKFMLMDAD